MPTFNKNNNNKKWKRIRVCVVNSINSIDLLKEFIIFILSLQCNLCSKSWFILALISHVPCQHDWSTFNRIGGSQCPSGSVPCHWCFCHSLSNSHWLDTEKTLGGKHFETNEFEEVEYLICIDCANVIALLFNSPFQNVIWSHIHHWRNTCKLE